MLRGDIGVHIHCYRADEMALMMDLAREFDFKIAAFHHGVEAYKLADRLAQEGRILTNFYSTPLCATASSTSRATGSNARSPITSVWSKCGGNADARRAPLPRAVQRFHGVMAP